MEKPPPLKDEELRIAIELLLENLKLTCIVIQGHRDLLAQMEQRGLFDPSTARTSVSELEQLEAHASRVRDTIPLLRKKWNLPESAA
jgi:hypothetical protein